MSDPRYTDPRTGVTQHRVTGADETGAQTETARESRIVEVNRSNAMWGWIAGGVVVALLLVFLFGSSSTTDQASNEMTAPPPGPTTLAPPANPPRTTPAPATTGQGAQ
jgi:multidrug efflux pump subunit AcrA (membrane-fusion protein)